MGENTPFASIIITGLVVAAMAIGFGYVASDTGTSYNRTVTDSNYTVISDAGANMVQIANATSASFFSNSTRTTETSSGERLVASGFSAVLLLGNIPEIYVAIINTIAAVIHMPVVLTQLMVAGIVILIVSVALWLALGRR